MLHRNILRIFFLIPFTACIQPFLLIFYSNDIKAFLSESVKRCFNGRLVFCTFGYLPAAQDINKWCVVDASLRTLSQLHRYTTAVELNVQVFVYVWQAKSKHQELFTKRDVSQTLLGFLSDA